MKKIFLGTVALIAAGMVAPASAADMAARPYKAPPHCSADDYDWSGFYLGVNGGYGWGRRCADITAVNAVAFAFAEGCSNSGGGIVGGQVGYRWQSSAWVFGLEAQGDWANIRNDRVQPVQSGEYLEDQHQRLGPLHGSGRLRLEHNPALCEGRRCGRQPAL